MTSNNNTRGSSCNRPFDSTAQFSYRPISSSNNKRPQTGSLYVTSPRTKNTKLKKMKP